MNNGFTGAVVAVAMGSIVGLLGVGALANGLDVLEARKCPGVTRILVNQSALLKEWAAWGACPRDGLVTPHKP